LLRYTDAQTPPTVVGSFTATIQEVVTADLNINIKQRIFSSATRRTILGDGHRG